MDYPRIVKAKCARERRDFGIEFQRMGDAWMASRTFPISQTQATRGFGEQAINNIQISMQYGDCPFCKNNSFFKCGTCQGLNCQGNAVGTERIHVTCANCNNGGYLEGSIRDLKSFDDM